MKDYTGYHSEDFVADESFQAFVLNTDPEAISFWTAWLASHPEKEPETSQAAEIIRVLATQTRAQPLPVSKEAELEKLFHRIRLIPEESPENSSLPSRANVRIMPVLGRVAAAIALLFIVGSVWFFYFKSTGFTEIRTEYGETQQVVLPDQSVVTLNTNSTLKYPKNWDKKGQREVWLEGEAFFEVTKQKTTRQSPVKFVVHTSQLKVEVLGTKFDVHARRQATRVVLAEGKVRLESASQGQLEMKPGELVSISNQRSGITKQKVNADLYASWRENKVSFNEVSLSEVAQSLEDYFGYRVIFTDSTVAGRRFKGTFPADNPEVWVETLSKTFPMQVDAENKQIIFE